MLAASRLVQGFLLVCLLSVVSLSGCLSPDLVTPAGASSADAPADATSVEYHWSGSSPVDAFVCGPVIACQGFVLQPTTWLTTLPDGGMLTAVHLELSWEPVNPTVGPMEFRFHHVDANGAFVGLLAVLKSDVSPIVIEWEGDVFGPGEVGGISAYPAEKRAVGPALVYADLAEQPFDVDGTLHFA